MNRKKNSEKNFLNELFQSNCLKIDLLIISDFLFKNTRSVFFILSADDNHNKILFIEGEYRV